MQACELKTLLIAWEGYDYKDRATAESTLFLINGVDVGLGIGGATQCVAIICIARQYAYKICLQQDQRSIYGINYVDPFSALGLGQVLDEALNDEIQIPRDQ